MIYRACLAGLCLLMSSLAHAAEDVQQTILLLPDEAAECRYVATLANNARAAVRSAEDLGGKVDALAATGAYREAAHAAIALSPFISGTVLNAVTKVTASTQAIRIKRGTLPPCAEPLYEEGQAGAATVTQLLQANTARLQMLTQQTTER